MRFVGDSVQATPTAALGKEFVEEALRLAAYRSALVVDAHRLRDLVQRSVPWPLVEHAWKALAAAPCVVSRELELPLKRSRADSVASAPTPRAPHHVVVFADPYPKVLQLLRACGEDGGVVCPGAAAAPTDLWLRFGCDALPLWQYSVTSVTCSLASCVGQGRTTNWKVQAANAWVQLALANATDSADVMRALILDTQIGTVSMAVNGLVVSVRCNAGHAHDMKLRTFWVGDHMALYKLTGADGVASQKPERRPCPWCNARPEQLSDLLFAPPVPLTQKPASMVPALPVDQVLPDPLHGLKNVVLNNLREATMRLMEEASVPLSEVEAALVPLESSVSSALRFVRDGLFGPVVELLSGAYGRRVVRGRPYAEVYADLWASLREQVRMLWTEGPVDAAAFRAVSVRFARACTILDVKRTVWLHIWVLHIPPMVERWGTLYHALGHGFEGHNRMVKKHCRCSTKSRWVTPSKAGFATVLEHDNVRLNLVIANARGLVPRRRPVQRYAQGYAAAVADATQKLVGLDFQ